MKQVSNEDFKNILTFLLAYSKMPATAKKEINSRRRAFLLYKKLEKRLI